MTSTLQFPDLKDQFRSGGTAAEEVDIRWAEEAFARQDDVIERRAPKSVQLHEGDRRRERLFMWLLAAAILFGVLVLIVSTVPPGSAPAPPQRPVTAHVATTHRPASAPSTRSSSKGSLVPIGWNTLNLLPQIEPLPGTHTAPVRGRISAAPVSTRVPRSGR